MNKLYIVRHGKTDWNIKGLLQGLTDISLNMKGIKETNTLKEKIDLNDIDICISSPLKRAKMTAQILVDNKKEIIYDDMLKERAFGNFEGKSIDFDLVCKLWDYKLNYSENNVESIKDCLDRAKKFLDKIKKEHPNETILIVSHGSFIKALHYNLVGYDEDTSFLTFNPSNATIYSYDFNK